MNDVMFFRKLLSNGTYSCRFQATRSLPSHRFGYFNRIGTSFRFFLGMRQLPYSPIRGRLGDHEHRIWNQGAGNSALSYFLTNRPQPSFSAALFPFCSASSSPPISVYASRRAGLLAISRVTIHRVATTSSTLEAWN